MKPTTILTYIRPELRRYLLFLLPAICFLHRGGALHAQVPLALMTASIPRSATDIKAVAGAAIRLAVIPSGRDIVAFWTEDEPGQYLLFGIEYSSNGIQFVPAGKIEAMKAGKEKMSYEFIHSDAALTQEPVFYYRLRLTRKDNSEMLTPVVALHLNLH